MDNLDISKSFVLKPNDFNETSFDTLNIENYYFLENSNNKYLINRINICNNKKLYIETDYLKVKEVNIENNKLILEPINNSLINIFNSLDEKCKLLLQNLIDSDETLDTLNIEWNSDNIQYNTIFNNNNNLIKIYINKDTTIKHNSHQISINDINIDDNVAIMIGVDLIALLLDTMQAKTKLEPRQITQR